MNMVKVMYLVMAQMRKTVYICSEGDVLDNGPDEEDREHGEGDVLGNGPYEEDREHGEGDVLSNGVGVTPHAMSESGCYSCRPGRRNTAVINVSAIRDYFIKLTSERAPQ